MPTCAHGSSVSVMGNAFFLSCLCVFFCCFLGCFVHMGSTSLAGLPVMHMTWVAQVCLLLDTPFGRRSVEALHL